MDADLSDLNPRLDRYMSMLHRHFVDEFAVTAHQLDEFFLDELKPYREAQDTVPCLKAKLDAFEAIPSVTSHGAHDQQARVEFVRALQSATAADGGSRDKHLNRLCSMFTILRGGWFISLFTDSLPTVPNTPVYGLRDDAVAAAK